MGREKGGVSNHSLGGDPLHVFKINSQLCMQSPSVKSSYLQVALLQRPWQGWHLTGAPLIRSRKPQGYGRAGQFPKRELAAYPDATGVNAKLVSLGQFAEWSHTGVISVASYKAHRPGSRF